MSKKITKSWLNKETDGFLPATEDNIQKAKDFAFKKWRERAIERGRQEPVDLSFSCKFCSLFVKQVFGGRIEGNYDHQYNVIYDQRIDLSEGSADVLTLDKPYYHDTRFFGCKDHLDSLNSCLERVDSWTELFTAELIASIDDLATCEPDEMDFDKKPLMDFT